MRIAVNVWLYNYILLLESAILTVLYNNQHTGDTLDYTSNSISSLKDHPCLQQPFWKLSKAFFKPGRQLGQCEFYSKEYTQKIWTRGSSILFVKVFCEVGMFDSLMFKRNVFLLVS